jgi:hypothetical protein|nr:MAG TPA: hypothetical protein [Caudoviricetes sp.]
MKTVIKGAVYKRENDLVIPHYTGEFWMVDCDNYVTMEELEQDYDEDYIKEVEDNYIEYDEVKYYYAEYSPEHVEDSWELLSDISELRLTEINI